MTKKESKYQEEHRCKHPNHPTTHVRMNYTCPKARKCPDRYDEGCIAK